MIRADFVLRRAGLLVTMTPRSGDPLGRIRDAALASFEGRVVWVGPEDELESKVQLDGEQLDAHGLTVLPGLVDAHTHPVFAGSRADEFAQRLSGVAYAEQQAGDRGVMRTVRATRAASEDQLLALARDRASRFLAHGTTTIEAKTGYGLGLETESRCLDVLERLARATPLRIVPTFLGAHVVPAGVDRAAYVRAILEEMLPAFRGRARYCDAWCDPPAFSALETRAVLEKARSLGYQLRVHAAQLAPGDGPTIAAELGASSADHLEFATPEQLRALAMGGTVAVLCPGANFTVPRSPRPPIEAMREAGVAIAIASDLNPGTSNSESLTFAMSLACILWGMTPDEVLLGATVHAARSLGMQGVAGCLRPGSFADLTLFDVGAVEEIPYHVGVNRAVMTVVGGRRWCPP